MRHLSIAILIASAAVLGGCTTERAAGVCCVSEVDCARLGVDEPRPCEAGQACRDFGCVAAECATSADCTSPGAPVCADQLCVAACRDDADCTGAPAGPRCAADGACVGCLADAECRSSAPFCDAEDRRCRGCEVDAECASGVCIEADGVCAEPSQLVHVRMGGSDTGECTSVAPCGSLSYALQKVSFSRDVIRVTGAVLATPSSTIVIDRAVVIDADGSTLVQPLNMPLFSVGASVGVVTLEGFVLTGSSSSDPTIQVASGSTLRIARSRLDSAPIEVVNGSLQLHDSHTSSALSAAAVRCTNGTVSVQRTELAHTTIEATNCQLNVAQSRFDQLTDGSILAKGGVALIENNLVITSYELADLMSLTNLAPGSTVRFNTFVNTSGVISDGVALMCSGGVAVTSNIFAYGSAHPLGTPPMTPCAAKFSLFDSITDAQQTAGEGNLVRDAATFFVNRAVGNYHLATGSPARQAGEAGLPVSEDFEGHRRPVPAGSRPDIGCFEAP